KRLAVNADCVVAATATTDASAPAGTPSVQPGFLARRGTDRTLESLPRAIALVPESDRVVVWRAQFSAHGASVSAVAGLFSAPPRTSHHVVACRCRSEERRVGKE